MSDVVSSENQEFWAELPDGCPPEDSWQPQDVLEVVRLVRQDPPTNEDFQSFRMLHPERSVPVSECEACGLSVFTDIEDAERKRKLPRLKGTLPCLVQLTSGSGRIKQTGQPSHHTWWPAAHFPILDHCQVFES